MIEVEEEKKERRESGDKDAIQLHKEGRKKRIKPRLEDCCLDNALWENQRERERSKEL